MIIRWVCEKCDKKWIYPVEKCIFCKGNITKQKGTKIKVVGMTKVNIPSPMHPITPYNILLLQDEFGNRIPKKTMKEYKIEDIYVEERAKTKNAVAVIKIKYDIYEAIKYSLELIGGMNFDKKDRILIKPSAVAAAYPYQAVNTNPKFIDALLDILEEKGVKKENILVAEQALIGSDASDAASKAGILEICKKHGVGFADISKGPFEVIESDGITLKIFKEALHRKIINVPVMKTNFQLGISGAVENLSRLVDESTQRKMYFEGVDNSLPNLVKLLKDVLTIADGTNGMQGQGPLALGEPAFLNLVLTSNNAANLDVVFCETTMLPIPSHVANSGDKVELKNIEVVGNDLDALKYPIKQPSSNETPHSDIKVIDFKACPKCLNMLYNLSSKLVGLRGREIEVVMGSMFSADELKGKERIVLLGSCAIRRSEELKMGPVAKIGEDIGDVEQLVLLKKLLTTEGTPKITNVDKVKSKITKLFSKVAK